MMSHKLSTSILNADFGNLQQVATFINQSEADWFHLDIMDGVFVPNISYGFPVIDFIKKHALKPLDVHLMIVEPDKYVEKIAKAGVDILTVHYETCTHLHRTIQYIKSNKMKAGVALNPHTPVSLLEEIIQDIDMVLIMSVNPGFGGQEFIKQSYRKIEKLKNIIEKSGAETKIEVDGGIDLSNVKSLLNAGADILVVGSCIFKSNNPTETIHKIKNIALI